MKKLVAFLVLSFSLFAGGVSFVKVKSVGYGDTEKEAISDALARAVEKANGVSLTKAELISRSRLDGEISINGYGNDIKASTSLNTELFYKRKSGGVKSYKILSVVKLRDGYRAKILATVSKYETSAIKDKISLAVLPFSHKRFYSVYQMEIDGAVLARRLADALLTKFVKSGRFTVLDREDFGYYESEKRFLLSGDSDPSELARLGKRIGADYFVVGKIFDFEVESKEESNYYTGIEKFADRVYATISYKVLHIPTQSVKYADTLDIEIKAPSAKRAESFVLKVSDLLAERIFSKISKDFGFFVKSEKRDGDKAEKKEAVSEGKESMFDEMFR